MAISNYTTTVSALKSIQEVQEMLLQHGAIETGIKNLDKMPVELSFKIDIKGTPVVFILAANWQGVLQAMAKDPKTKQHRNNQQALNTAWRIIRDWVKAQLALIEAEVTSFMQAFLPYALLQDGQTVFNQLDKNNFNNLLQ